ncbi:hypothetical protein [Salinibaculum rarum]|uniref:hypothetical protein n=1 Tax=Salinibaculum rarum TaxID=3058903 RepID=UPI00265F385B|nr:hypothetical protein [Salinibaculum sp. KK48]
MSSFQDYLLPEWAQYTVLFITVTAIFSYQLILSPSRLLLVTGGGAVIVFGGMMWISVMSGDDPLEHGIMQQVIVGYVLFATLYLVTSVF